MRLTVEIDGKPTSVEVADDLATVRLGDRTYPVKVVGERPLRVELEIGGETVVVDGWPAHEREPPGPVDVNGERRPVAVRIESGPRPAAPAPAGPSPSLAAGAPSAAPAPPGATAVVPPMPGRVVEVRVRDGETVAKGAVLLVVEAMKMRNEVAAPVAGVVRDLRVREGSSVRAHEAMLLLVPASG